MSTSIKYAYRKGQTWLYRRTYPKDLQPVLGSSLKQSLKTVDLREAKARVSEVNAAYEDIVAKARDALKAEGLGAKQGPITLPVAYPRFSLGRTGQETVSNLARPYLSGKSDTLSPGGFKSHRFSLGLFVSRYGSRRIGSLSRLDGISFLNEIRALSPDRGKSFSLKGASLAELVALSQGNSRKITPQTQKRIWSQVTQFMAWAVREGHLDQTPFGALQVAAKPEVRSYSALTDREVTALLGVRDPILPPILVISLLSGMRSGELCGLLAEDISLKGNLGAFFRIRSNDLRSLKTRAAERDVPVHDTIQRHILPGLPKAGPLFAQVTVDRVVKHFAKARVALGIDRSGVVFHSARKWTCPGLMPLL